MRFQYKVIINNNNNNNNSQIIIVSEYYVNVKYNSSIFTFIKKRHHGYEDKSAGDFMKHQNNN